MYQSYLKEVSFKLNKKMVAKISYKCKLIEQRATFLENQAQKWILFCNESPPTLNAQGKKLKIIKTCTISTLFAYRFYEVAGRV